MAEVAAAVKALISRAEHFELKTRKRTSLQGGINPHAATFVGAVSVLGLRPAKPASAPALRARETAPRPPVR